MKLPNQKITSFFLSSDYNSQRIRTHALANASCTQTHIYARRERQKHASILVRSFIAVLFTFQPFPKSPKKKFRAECVMFLLFFRILNEG